MILIVCKLSFDFEVGGVCRGLLRARAGVKVSCGLRNAGGLLLRSVRISITIGSNSL